MKTAVSIPDDIFEAAETYARRTKRSRSRLFSEALQEYLSRRTPEKLTEAMDEALARIGDPKEDRTFTSESASRLLKDSEW